MKAILENLITTLAIAALVLIGYMCGRNAKRGPLEPVKTKTDTLYLRDTLHVPVPVPVARRVTDTLYLPADTTTVHDTLFVLLEREQLTYSDSTFTAWVSGVRPALDSIHVYQQTRVVTTTVTLRDDRRWHLSAGVGPSVIYSPFTGHIDAGIGIFAGVSYNF